MGTDSREVKEVGAVEIQYRLFYILFKPVRNVFVLCVLPKMHDNILCFCLLITYISRV